MDSRSKIYIEAKFLPSQEIRSFSDYSSPDKTALENCLSQVKSYAKVSNEEYSLLYIFSFKETLHTPEQTKD